MSQRKKDFTLGVPELEATKEENDPSNRDKNQIRTKKKYIPNRFSFNLERKNQKMLTYDVSPNMEIIQLKMDVAKEREINACLRDEISFRSRNIRLC